MASQANIAVFDGAATPVTHTLVPIGVAKTGSVVEASWREANVSLPIMAQIRLVTRSETLKSGVMRLSASSVVPVMETAGAQNAAGYTAPPKVAYETTFTTTEYKSPRSTISDSRLARQLHVNLLGNVATSVTAITTGFLPELFDQAVNPS